MKLTETTEDFREKQRDMKQEAIKDLLDNLSNDIWLWDMRCWNKYKDLDEIKKYVEDPDSKGSNSSICDHSVKALKKLGMPVRIIIRAIMSNPFKQYAKVIVKNCWDNPERCPKYKEQKQYGKTMCDGCE